MENGIASIVFVDGNVLMNCTPHPIKFQVGNGDTVIIPPSGQTLKATPQETVVAESNGITYVKTIFVGDTATLEFLDVMRTEYPNVILVGSIISAQAYPGSVVSLVPVPGFERAAPSDKLYHANKFNIF